MGLRHLAPDVRHHHGVPGPGDVRSHRPIHVAEPDETDAAHGVIRPVFVRNSLWPWEKRSISASSRSCMATSRSIPKHRVTTVTFLPWPATVSITAAAQ